MRTLPVLFLLAVTTIAATGCAGSLSDACEPRQSTGFVGDPELNPYLDNFGADAKLSEAERERRFWGFRKRAHAERLAFEQRHREYVARQQQRQRELQADVAQLTHSLEHTFGYCDPCGLTVYGSRCYRPSYVTTCESSSAKPYDYYKPYVGMKRYTTPYRPYR